MSDLLELAKVFGATSAILMVAVVFLWRRNTALTDELVKTIRAYEGFTTKTRVALEQLTEIVKVRGGR